MTLDPEVFALVFDVSSEDQNLKVLTQFFFMWPCAQVFLPVLQFPIFGRRFPYIYNLDLMEKNMDRTGSVVKG